MAEVYYNNQSKEMARISTEKEATPNPDNTLFHAYLGIQSRLLTSEGGINSDQDEQIDSLMTHTLNKTERTSVRR